MATGHAPTPARIALVSFPGVRAFDVSVITEVWGVDRTDRGVPPFDLRRIAADLAPIPLRGGLSLAPDRALSWLTRADLIVVPGLDDHLTPAPAPVLEALRRAHARSTPIAALCGGAFTLAQAGLLDGRRAVTHWNLTDLLRAHHPRVTVVPDALFLHDDNIWTSAGTAAASTSASISSVRPMAPKPQQRSPVRWSRPRSAPEPRPNSSSTPPRTPTGMPTLSPPYGPTP